MNSDVVIKNSNPTGLSQMVKAIHDVAGKIDTIQDGLYDHNIILTISDKKTGAKIVEINNDELDIEFDVPFDDDIEVNEAEIIVYNLTDTTINAIASGAAVTITAGYGKDTGVIFSGFLSAKRTKWEDCDKVTTLYALDSNGKKETEITNMSFAKKTKASKILKKLVSKLGLTIAVFGITRDHTFKDKVTISGGLTENIKKYAEICGVVAYVCKSNVYVCPLSYGTHDTFNLSADTGLLTASEFEEEITAEKYNDKIRGLEIEMLLQNKIQTGSIIKIDSKNVKGEYRVREGSHYYDGEEFITKVKAISMDSIKTAFKGKVEVRSV